MDVILSASIIASFVAGMIALFAPCCISVLLPAYLGSAFREKKNIIKMTFVFFAGISVVLVPIGLGAAGLAEAFRDLHKELYIFGGLLMLFLAVYSIRGSGISMPLPKWLKPKMNTAVNVKSVFVLGIFSGAATSCCAPVLAGAMTLAVLSGAFWKALLVVFAYVFGMVFPLFIAAYFYDKYQIEKSKIIQGKLIEIPIGKKKITVHSTNLLASIIFAFFGVVMLFLAFSGNAFWSPTVQAGIGDKLNQWSLGILDVLMAIPDIIWAIVILGLFAFFFWKIKSHKKN